MKITLQDRRTEALRIGFAALLERLPHGFSFEEFCAAFADWDVRAFCDGERAVGMLVMRGAELHVAVLPEVRGRWLSRRLIREVFKPILDLYGKAQTSVEDDNEVGKDFVNRLREGFETNRFDPVSVLTSVGGSIVSGLIGAKGSEKAAQTAANAQNQATDTQLQMFNTQNAQQEPYRQAGAQGLASLNYLLGVPQGTAGVPSSGVGSLYAYGYGSAPGGLLHQFNAQDLNANLAPNYEFMKQQGLGATENALTRSGGALGGNALQGLTKFAEDYAGNAYQNAFANYTTNQTNIFNRLASIAGLGQTANAQGVQLAGALAPSIAQTQVGAGQALAAGTMGVANALVGGGNNAMGWYQLGNLMNQGNQGSTTIGNPGGITQIGDYGAS